LGRREQATTRYDPGSHGAAFAAQATLTNTLE
jgi:hypothetical protein